MSKDQEKLEKKEILDQILVEVYPQRSSMEEEEEEEEDSIHHAKELFTEINKAEPVKLVDMPGVAKGTDRKIITHAAQSMQDLYPTMFKPSQKCRAPHLNLDNLRDAIFAAGILARREVTTVKGLVAWLEEQNMDMKSRYVEELDPNRKPVSKAALEKAIKYDFYLGLDMAWLYR